MDANRDQWMNDRRVGIGNPVEIPAVLLWRNLVYAGDTGERLFVPRRSTDAM